MASWIVRYSAGDAPDTAGRRRGQPGERAQNEPGQSERHGGLQRGTGKLGAGPARAPKETTDAGGVRFPAADGSPPLGDGPHEVRQPRHVPQVDHLGR
jgi:hypothetical protein